MVVDAIGARSGLAGISVILPDVARMSQDRASQLELRVRNERQKPRILRVALSLPRDIKSPQDEVEVLLPAASEWSRFSWRSLPLRRGSYRLGAAYLEAG